MSADLNTIVAYLNEYLRVSEVPDYANALNGLQVETSRPIRRIAAAVDASEQAISLAVERDCDLLLVHHGLFWDGLGPLTGRRYRKVKRCFDAGLAIYSSHIPLDLHPEVGNSALLARTVGASIKGKWADYKDVEIGVWGELDIGRDELRSRLEEALKGSVRLLPGGPERVTRVGVVTGAAGSMINEAIATGLDAFITGEGAHHTYFDAMEGGINVYYGGHYATETWGVRALAAHLSERFGLSWEFLDLPTGL